MCFTGRLPLRVASRPHSFLTIYNSCINKLCLLSLSEVSLGFVQGLSFCKYSLLVLHGNGVNKLWRKHTVTDLCL